MPLVTDPALLQQLNAPQQQGQAPQQTQQSGGKLVTDPTLLAQLNAPQAQPQQGQLPQVQTPALPGMIGALGNAAASTIESGGDAAIWLANKLGMSDQKAQMAKQALNSTINNNVAGLGVGIRTSADGDQSDPFNKSMKENPILSKTTEYTADALALAKSAPKTASWVANTVMNAIAGAGIASNPNDKNNTSSNIGAGIAAVATPAGALLQKGVQTVAKAWTLLPSAITSFIQPALQRLAADGSLSVGEKAMKAESAFTRSTLSTADSLYAPIKVIPGTIEQKPIVTQINNLLQNPGLSDSQIRTLAQTKDAANKMTNMDLAVKLRQFISGNKSDFQGSQVIDSVKNQYQDILQNVDNSINQKAVQVGLGPKLQEANSFWENQATPLYASKSVQRMNLVEQKAKQDAYILAQKTQGNTINPVENKAYAQATNTMFPTNMSAEQLRSVASRMGPAGNQIIQDHLVLSTFRDAIVNPQNFNQNSALMQVNNVLNKYSEVLTPQTKQVMTGAKTLLEEAGSQAQKSKTGQILGNQFSQRVAGSMIAGGAGYAEGGSQQGSEGAVAGFLLGPVAVQGMTKFTRGALESTQGQWLMKQIAAHPEIAHGVIQNLIMAGPAAISSNQPDKQ